MNIFNQDLWICDIQGDILSMGGAPSPPPVPTPPPAAAAPTMASTQSGSSGTAAAARARAAAAYTSQGSTVGQGGPQGLTQQASVAPQTLLGQ